MSGKELVRLLKKHGWSLDRIHGSHYIMMRNEKTLSVPVHGNRDLPKGLLAAILKQGGVR
jgi:predicted RNA binding protein YcfA (HicA-like mRNA interferase family)